MYMYAIIVYSTSRAGIVTHCRPVFMWLSKNDSAV